MKLSIERDELLRGLGRVQAIVERRGTMPILANVLIEAREDGLTLAATDLEVAVVANHPASVKTPGSVTLGAKKLYEIVRELEGPEVLLSTDDGARVTLTCGPAKFALLSTSPEEYPSIAERRRRGIRADRHGARLRADRPHALRDVERRDPLQPERRLHREQRRQARPLRRDRRPPPGDDRATPYRRRSASSPRASSCRARAWPRSASSATRARARSISGWATAS